MRIHIYAIPKRLMPARANSSAADCPPSMQVIAVQ